MQTKEILMKKSLLFLALACCLTACSPQIGGYNLALDTVNGGAGVAETRGASYSDQVVAVNFGLQETLDYKGVSGFSQYDNYSGILFSLVNKTDQTMTIDWNRVSYIDLSGNAGNAVMHKGIKYTNCSGQKAPSVIPPHGRMHDVITPCCDVEFDEGVHSMGVYIKPKWKIEMLPNPETCPRVRFGVYMPLEIEGQRHEYTFLFAGTQE